jgi:hypothetical protein
LLLFFSSFQYEHSTTYSKNSSYHGEAPQNHPRDPLPLYGIIRKNERRERDSKNQIELESLEKRSEERNLKLQIELEEMLDKKIDSSKIPFKLK